MPHASPCLSACLMLCLCAAGGPPLLRILTIKVHAPAARSFVIPIARAAGSLKRGAPDAPEEAVLYRTMLDLIQPKLTFLVGAPWAGSSLCCWTLEGNGARLLAALQPHTAPALLPCGVVSAPPSNTLIPPPDPYCVNPSHLPHPGLAAVHGSAGRPLPGH